MRYGLQFLPLPASFPEVMAHSRKVTDLALTIFDDLTPLHQMGAHERFLLECTALLHDIGWKFGHKGHSKRGADMIVSDEYLPFDLHEQGNDRAGRTGSQEYYPF